MNRIRFALPPVLVFSLITLGHTQQQESGQQPDSIKQEETKHPQDATPPHKPAAASPSRESRPQEEKPPKPEKPEASKPPKEQPKAGQEERQEQRGQAEQGGGNTQKDADKDGKNGKSARAPDAQFKARMGHQHSFTVNRVVTQTTIVPNQTQFVYGGYTFVFLDPWPAAWLFTDDCYIDYVDDQYFLFNPLHPEIRVSLLVVG